MNLPWTTNEEEQRIEVLDSDGAIVLVYRNADDRLKAIAKHIAKCCNDHHENEVTLENIGKRMKDHVGTIQEDINIHGVNNHITRPKPDGPGNVSFGVDAFGRHNVDEASGD